MIAGLVLAAGSGSRLGQAKAPLQINGERLVDRAVRILREGGCDDVLVVLGAWQGDVPNAEVVTNEEWASGMGSSLMAGLRALTQKGDATHAVVTLVDLPGVTPAAVRRIVEQDGELVVGTHDGRRGHPLKLARNHWPAIMRELAGDAGARGYLRGRSDVVGVELADVADNQDIDTPADLAAVGQRLRERAMRQDEGH